MILQSYYELAQAIHQAVPELDWIDLDKGQFEDPDQNNTPVLPSVLIDFSEIDWQTFGEGTQLGSGTVTIKLGVRLPAQTHLSDPFAASNLKPFTMATTINYASKPGFMRERIGSHDYPVKHFHVIEQTYKICLTPDPPNYQYISLPVQLTTSLKTTVK